MVKEAEILNAELSPNKQEAENNIEIPSQNKSEKIQLNINQLLTVKAVENYIEIYSINETSIDKHLVRNTLKNVEHALSAFHEIKKCHRSYLVNLKNVAHFSGNAQGLTLSFNHSSEMKVPVSRSFVKEIKEQLHQNVS